MTKEQRQYNGTKIVFSTNSAGKLDNYTQKQNESRHIPYTLYKVNSNWIINLNVKHKSIRLLKDNIGKNIDDPGYGNDFLDFRYQRHNVRKK